MEENRDRLFKKKNQWAIASVPQLCSHWRLFVHILDGEEGKQPLDWTTFVPLRQRVQSKETYVHTVQMGTSRVQCIVGYTHSEKLSCLTLFKALFRCLSYITVEHVMGYTVEPWNTSKRSTLESISSPGAPAKQARYLDRTLKHKVDVSVNGRLYCSVCALHWGASCCQLVHPQWDRE